MLAQWAEQLLCVFEDLSSQLQNVQEARSGSTCLQSPYTELRWRTDTGGSLETGGAI